MFAEYPDVMRVEDAAKALGICKPVVYKLIRNGALDAITIGRAIRVPKVCLIDFVQSACTHNQKLVVVDNPAGHKKGDCNDR